MNRVAFITVLLFFCTSSFAQNGYVKFDKDSVLTGFIRMYTAPGNKKEFLEFWKTKNDRQPIRIDRRDIVEYAIRKDTFHVLRNFQPFPSEDIFFEVVDARIIRNGRIQLLKMKNPYYRTDHIVAGGLAGGVVVAVSVSLMDKVTNVPYILALREPSNGYIRAVPKKAELFDEVMSDFFSEKAITSFVKNKEELKFRTLVEFVDYYNARMSGKK
jgi:hypothetical protein